MIYLFIYNINNFLLFRKIYIKMKKNKSKRDKIFVDIVL